ncbi:ABC transporter ATP-binding protein [Enteractinococcus coprophilus]|uniref:ABC-2 type transport system ATP-binding protein n=1 Tax=Enteractinococcus coprophilus TaxID=1027633 RepID=A0A543AP76_9MICC|nr:ABC transporter ATP-binding protein [Enteractinococcus coprophilus]TQL74390.1 ABC-2 type transport system ATP-binding protein [Enteractinococcus coprophilus]
MTTPTTDTSVRAIEAQGLTRRFKDTIALDDVTLNFEKDKIHGLLGRNGAGKTTLMSVMTAQDWPTSGSVRVFGQVPHENEQILPNICFVREEQRYPEDALAKHAFRAAREAFENWDEGFAQQLIEEFRVPKKTTIKKMSRGQKSAVGVIIGLASRAPLTVFDEPYMGLDAVARQLFYDRLLQDYSEHPRTVVVSSHLIDEISHLLEHVVVIDQGKIMVDESAEELAERAVTVVGRADSVAQVVGAREVLDREDLGRIARVTVLGKLNATERCLVNELDLDLIPVSLQQLIVHLTRKNGQTNTASEGF